MITRRHFTAGMTTLAATALLRPAFAAGPITSTVVRDVASGRDLFRDGPHDRRYSPCSTFKFAIAVMGFDAGILVDPHNPRLDYQPTFDPAADWAKKPTDPTVWLRDSIVWYSQQTTRKLGAARFQAYVDKLDYGNRDLSGNPGKNDGLTQAWLMSSLKISPDEQVGFVERFLDRRLPIAPRTYDMVAASLAIFDAPGGWTVHGKTGTGDYEAGGKKLQQGWFVGWAEQGSRRLAFARIALDLDQSAPGGIVARDGLLKDLAGYAAL
jgi:beta-lactamase class D